MALIPLRPYLAKGISEASRAVLKSIEIGAVKLNCKKRRENLSAANRDASSKENGRWRI